MPRASNRWSPAFDLVERERDACGVGFLTAGNGQASHAILQRALTALKRLSHRGGLAADGKTGDGAGVMTELPRAFFAREFCRQGLNVTGNDPFAVAMCFFPGQEPAAARARQLLSQACAEQGLHLAGWRTVPTDDTVLGDLALQTRPQILQALVTGPAGIPQLALERKLYLARRTFERRWTGDARAYVVSMSSRVIVYKGLMMADQMAAFYPDLTDPAFVTRFAIFHQRYSTNTMPSWERAQPFRLLAHNGEINTLQGNVNGIRAREPLFRVPDWPEATPEALRDVIDLSGSDSAMLDNVAELVALCGRELPHVFAMLVPEAWEGISDLPDDVRAFYRFHACLTEPWDGPAALVFSDGRWVGARLDRNGLRPMRYTVLKDGSVLAGSEVGIFDIDPSQVEIYGKLGPGQMIAVHLPSARYWSDAELRTWLAGRRPYGQWLAAHLIDPWRAQAAADRVGCGAPSSPAVAQHSVGTAPGEDVEEAFTRLQAAFGYTSEEITVVIKPMVDEGKEANGSMGDDTPHAVLSHVHRPLFHYFKQRFAQVTNPAIDHLRERLVFSLTTRLGPRPNLLIEAPEQAHVIELPSPFLTDAQLAALKAIDPAVTGFGVAVLSTLFPVAGGPEALAAAVARLEEEAERAVDAGAGIIVLSDRGVDRERAPIPSLLATGAVHHHLIRVGKRALTSLVVESGEPREVHHMAALIGYGAGAINPYLALATAVRLGAENRNPLSPEQAVRNFIGACEEGLMKVMSKMGISTVDAYQGAQIFEAVGLSADLIDRCFRGTPSRVGGNSFREIAEDVLAWHRQAFADEFAGLDSYGFYKFKKDGEHHAFNPAVIKAIHTVVQRNRGVLDGDFLDHYDSFKRFVHLVESGPPNQLRDLMEIVSDREPIPIDEVEPIENITRRFSTAAISLGSISPEAHETIAIAMNRIGGRSNTGEGGEDPARYGTERNSAVKQVASGRFGVTPAYLANGIELQIKIAQGSKPGEGGQIPGHKVSELIARLRHTVPGVELISPPPHHDIYSIEDLAQLIYDLKQANPEALVSVKLVAETGVGIIAAGVAKGFADAVHIAGHMGGTGSSPLTSIKHAGLPWEIGLAETQHALVANGLRGRITVRVDGGLKTGRDVIIAALLGADEYSFGTAALVAEGCVMARACHTNNCPVGIATQQERLRARFPGTPEGVIDYFLYLAQHVRELLARMGYRSLDEIVGRADLLRQRKTGDPRADRLDLSALLQPAGDGSQPIRRLQERVELPDASSAFGRRLAAELREAVRTRTPVQRTYRITNVDRTVGATLAYEIAKRYGDEGLPDGTIRLKFEGLAGQSFGAFCINGMHLELVGQANDYVGKGMAGGQIVVKPAPGAPTDPERHVIIGNTVLYGATGGRLFVAGSAGERFAVRNSGAWAVVEGVGDHACEYMTGGVVVILGRTGHNLGAGMTGGEAFVYDPDGRLEHRCNPKFVKPVPVDARDAVRLRSLIAAHLDATGSPRARAILDNWDAAIAHFRHVLPLDAKGGLRRPPHAPMAVTDESMAYASDD